MTVVSPGSASHLKSDYLAMVQRKRLYSGVMLVIFVALLASGFNLADERNAGGFWDGLPQIFDFPAELIAEAIWKASALPGNLAEYFPALIETINIAAVSTLVGAIVAIG